MRGQRPDGEYHLALLMARADNEVSGGTATYLGHSPAEIWRLAFPRLEHELELRKFKSRADNVRQTYRNWLNSPDARFGRGRTRSIFDEWTQRPLGELRQFVEQSIGLPFTISDEVVD